MELLQQVVKLRNVSRTYTSNTLDSTPWGYKDDRAKRSNCSQLKRIKGQLEGVVPYEDEKTCIDVVRQVIAARLAGARCTRSFDWRSEPVYKRAKC
jgi:hypothetical protein